MGRREHLMPAASPDISRRLVGERAPFESSEEYEIRWINSLSDKALQRLEQRLITANARRVNSGR
jgi:hypothetical protein